MKLDQSFEVNAPIDRVWSALIDVERVAPCLPGAAVTGRNEDGSYNGTFTIKIGPTTASYTGVLTMKEVDEANRRAVMEAHGTDKRGQGGADATIVSTLRELAPGRTLVEVSTDYRITGRLARFGRGGMIEDIAEKLLRQFAAALQQLLESEGAGDEAPSGDAERPSSADDHPPAQSPSELSALPLVASALLTRLRRNPAPAVAVLVATLFLLRRRCRK
ncbi:MAG: SRPBCC family protein [Solirubrobacteraceae bacterium]